MAEEFGDGAGVVFEDAGAEGDFVASVGDGFADVLGFPFGKDFEVGADAGGDFEKDFGAFAGGEIAPSLAEGFVGGFDGGVEVGNFGGGDFAEGLFVVGIDLGRAFDCGLEFVVNEKVNGQFHF